MVNLEWYRTFVAIYKSGNLTRAAEELFISQPNVSVQLSNLESYMGHQLFVRKPRQMVPTELAKLLYTQVISSIENLERVEATFRKSALKKSQIIRIGAPIEYGLTKLLEQIGETDYQIELTFGLCEQLVEQLKDDKLDFVIATQQIKAAGLKYDLLQEEQFYLIANQPELVEQFNCAIQRESPNQVEQLLSQQRWVTFDHKLSIVRRFWHVNFKSRPQMSPHFVIPDLLGIKQAVASGMGIAIMSDIFLKDQVDSSNFKLVWAGYQPVVNEIYLCYREGKVLEEHYNWLSWVLNKKNENMVESK